jgi:D-alanyl-lipoteichoic acid acyltransferase DltB (MBOAT superfamily)
MRWPRLLLALCGVGLALLLGETAARIAGTRICADEPGGFYQEDPALGWRQRPNVVGWVSFCKGRALPPTFLETDERGFRNPGRPIEKTPGTARILLLGGNLPQALGVSWPLSVAGMLEGLADARAGRPLEVVNGAMGSFALDQDLLLLRQEGTRVAPDLVVAFVDAVVETAALSPELIGFRSMRAPAKPYFDVIDGALAPLALPPPDPPVDVEPPASGLSAASALVRWMRGIQPTHAPPQRWLPASVTSGNTSPDAARARGDRVLRALLRALHDESAALGAPFAVVIGPPALTPRMGEESPTQHLLALLHEENIPSTTVSLAFWGYEERTGTRGVIPETTRLGADGSFVASRVVWSFLEKERLLPEGVVGVRVPGAGRVAPLDPFPGALAAYVWSQRTGPVARVVFASLAGVLLLWITAPLSARARDWVTLAISLGVLAALVGVVPAVAALAFALLFFVVVEIPSTWTRRPLVALVVALLVVGPLAWLATMPSETSVPMRIFVSLAGAMAILRCLDYARSRRRAAARPALVEYLLGLFFFPTFASGPIQTTTALAAARATGALAPETGAALAAHFAHAARGFARLVWGMAKLIIVPVCLNLVTPDVLASGGAAVGRGRLWIWTFEMTLYFWALYGGWSDVGIGAAAMAGVRVPENFRAPWKATSPGALWRRSYTTVTRRVLRLAGSPVVARFGAGTAVTAACIAGALWYAWTTLALYGVFGSKPGAWAALVAWGVVQSAAVLFFARRRAGDGGALVRIGGWMATQLVLALGWTLLLAFPRVPALTTLGIYARLVGLR